MSPLSPPPEASQPPTPPSPASQGSASQPSLGRSSSGTLPHSPSGRPLNGGADGTGRRVAYARALRAAGLLAALADEHFEALCSALAQTSAEDTQDDLLRTYYLAEDDPGVGVALARQLADQALVIDKESACGTIAQCINHLRGFAAPLAGLDVAWLEPGGQVVLLADSWHATVPRTSDPTKKPEDYDVSLTQLIATLNRYLAACRHERRFLRLAVEDSGLPVYVALTRDQAVELRRVEAVRIER